MLEKRALVVDDSKLALFVLKKMLSEESLVVDTAESAVEALGYLVHNKPDVIFLDHTMPGMNGLEALKIIKNNPNTATIPVMMYTSKEGEVYVSQARALGAVDILPKQLAPIALHNVLEKMHLVQTSEKKLQSDDSDDTVEHEASGRSQRASISPIGEAEQLSLLINDAEAALEKETLKQFVKQELEHHADLLGKISNRLDGVISEYKDNMADVLSAQQLILSRERSLFRLVLGVIVLSALVLGYYKLSEKLTSLPLEIASRLSAPEPQLAISPDISSGSALAQENIDTSGLLYVLEESMGNYFSMSFGQTTLREQQMQLLANLLVSLNAINYSGNLDILVHSGNFCVVPNDEGELVMPPANQLYVDCQVKQSFEHLEQNIVPHLRQFVKDIHINSGHKFNVAVVNWGGSQLSIPYPEPDETLTAGVWNEVAEQNQRIEIVFR